MKAILRQCDVLSAYGMGTDALWQGLMSRQTAIGETDLFAGRPFSMRLAGAVPNLSPQANESRVRAMLRRLLAPLAGRLDRETPLLLATTVGEIEYVQRAVEGEACESLAAFTHLESFVRQLLQLDGRATTVSSACASSLAAVATAARMVRQGRARRVLVVACDGLSELVYSGFAAMAGLSERAAKPFDRSRDGLTLGEAAGWALIEAGEGLPGEIEISGWASTTDAVHMTAPDREAYGLLRAINGSLKMAQAGPDAVDFIAAHGTGTSFNDAMEMKAFSRSFAAPRPVFSTKGGTGHTLAAAGLLQIAALLHSMREGVVPPTVGLESPDDDALKWATVAARQITRSRTALATSSGFGGVNTAMVLSRSES